MLFIKELNNKFKIKNYFNLDKNGIYLSIGMFQLNILDVGNHLNNVKKDIILYILLLLGAKVILLLKLIKNMFICGIVLKNIKIIKISLLLFFNNSVKAILHLYVF